MITQMGARKSGSFPVCRLTGDDIVNLATVFTDMAGHKKNDDNPIFRFETPTGTFTYNEFGIQSRRASQRDVRAIEMIAAGTKARARIYLDLEEGSTLFATTKQSATSPAVAVRSTLEVEGDEAQVFPIWDEITAIAYQRPSRVAALMNSGLEIFVLIAAFVAPLSLSLSQSDACTLLGTLGPT